MAEDAAQAVDIEQGDATEAQIQEITEGNFVTVKELADALKYSPAWISEMLHKGRIHGIKPTGGSWRIPASEAERIKKEGIPPLSRVKTAETPGEVVVPEEHIERVQAEPKERKEQPGEKGNDPGWPLSLFLRNK